MQKLKIIGNKTLKGEVSISGAKNAVLKLMAASILAKVSRDRYITEMAEIYPEYHFEKHKGYGTKLHYEMLEKYGISDIHRRTFLKKLTGEK